MLSCSQGRSRWLEIQIPNFTISDKEVHFFLVLKNQMKDFMIIRGILMYIFLN